MRNKVKGVLFTQASSCSSAFNDSGTIMVLLRKIQQAKSNKQVANSKQLDKVTYVAASATIPQGKWDQTH